MICKRRHWNGSSRVAPYHAHTNGPLGRQVPEYPVSQRQALVRRHGAHEGEDGVWGQLSDISKAGVEQSVSIRGVHLTILIPGSGVGVLGQMGRNNYVKHFLATLRPGMLSVEASPAGGVSSSPIGVARAAFGAW